MRRALPILSMVLFVLFALGLSVVISILFYTTGEMLLDEGSPVLDLLMKIGYLCGSLAAFVIGFRNVGIFGQLGLKLAVSSHGVKHLLSAFLIGLGMQALIFFLLMISGYPVTLLAESLLEWFLFGMIYSLIAHLCVSVAEELLFRGYMLDRLIPLTGYPLAVVVQAVCFSLLHAFNPGYNGLAFTGLFLFGVFTAQLTRISQGLWSPIVFHKIWNASQGAIFGYAVSGGYEPHRLYHMELEGPGWLSGGAFGPEAGVYCIVILALGVGWMIAKTWLPGKESSIMNTQDIHKRNG